MISRQLFDHHMKDALRTFYDPVRLQLHPLATLLVSSDVPRETRGQALRQLLRNAISSLRPPASVSHGRPEWLGYRVMWLRYVESLDREAICGELAISRASFYRHHRDAVQAVSTILWDRYRRQASSVTDQRADLSDSPAPELALDQAIRVARESPRLWVSLAELLDRIKRTVFPLAEEQGITLRLDAPSGLPMLYGDPAVLRQIVMNSLMEAIRHAATQTLELTVRSISDATMWRLRGLDRSLVSGEALPLGLDISRGVLGVYGGRFWIETDRQGSTMVCFTIPIGRPKTILVIDDDADTISLLEHYLQAPQYELRAAGNVDELRTAIVESVPDLILLDIIMPREDGWDVLQHLRTTQRTATVPIVVCSVLNEPRLAYALGADCVLQKPIDQETLLRTVQRLLDQPDKKVEVHPVGPEDIASM